VLVCDPGAEQSAKLRLGRIGFDRVLGVLDGGAATLAAHPEVVERASRLTAAQLEERRRQVPGLQLVDVRQPAEHAVGMLPGALPLPLTQLRARTGELDLGAPIVVYCAGGYRSSVAASLLRAAGAVDVSDVLGGFGACAVAAGARA